MQSNAKTKNVSYLYQIKNIVSEYSEEQQKSFIDTIILNKNSLLNFDYRFIQGESMSGIVIGGNIRCLLKLAGTEYMPDFSEKILFLESLGGGVERAAACLSQLRQLGVFKLYKRYYFRTIYIYDRKQLQTINRRNSSA